MRQFYDTFSTPIGEFSVAVAADRSVIATAFGGLAELRERFTPDEVIHDPIRAADVLSASVMARRQWASSDFRFAMYWGGRPCARNASA